ncbi:MAG: helix-turn-helix transcriptional regulator [Taibaiella sp.]|jgi:DNA-binding CsgD family transcriptional regulator
MKPLNCLWADRFSLIKFFHDAASMDICARLNYFHDTFPFAELLPVNFYLFDSKNNHLACNQTTLITLGDKDITEYFDLSLFEYAARKNWPKKLAERQFANNNAALSNDQAFVCEENSFHGNHEKKWQSRKEAIYDDNGQPIGIVGISILIGISEESIYWDDKTNRIVILSSYNNLVEFSMREFCVLQGILNGSTAEEIASHENISHKTVETYMARIKTKLNCRKQRDVISFCIKNDLAKNILEFQYDFIKH